MAGGLQPGATSACGRSPPPHPQHLRGAGTSAKCHLLRSTQLRAQRAASSLSVPPWPPHLGGFPSAPATARETLRDARPSRDRKCKHVRHSLLFRSAFKEPCDNHGYSLEVAAAVASREAETKTHTTFRPFRPIAFPLELQLTASSRLGPQQTSGLIRTHFSLSRVRPGLRVMAILPRGNSPFCSTRVPDFWSRGCRH